MRPAGAILLIVALAALAACDDPPPPSAGRGTRGGVSAEPVIAPSALPPPPGASASGPQRGERRRVPVPPPLPPSEGGGGDAPAAPALAASPRSAGDPLRESLERAFGTPTQCISEPTRARLSGTLTIQVQVTVTSVGRVTRANVSASQLAPADLECMRRHAETLRIASDVPNAPRSVTASVEYRVTPAGAIETRREVPDAPPVAGRVAPSSTLPGAGAVTERPAGSVAPSSTLPAEGTETGRPAGSVAPSFTLPAMVE